MLNKYQIMEAVKPDTTRMKVAVIGSRVYENRKKIRETIFKLKQKFGWVQLPIQQNREQQEMDNYVSWMDLSKKW